MAPRVAALLILWILELPALGCDSRSPSVPQAGSARVISLAPSITRILVALGATDELVGVDSYSLRLGELSGVPSVGGLFSPDLERTVELDPSLVLAVESAEQRAFCEALRRRGVRVETLAPQSLEEQIESIQTIGGWLGIPDRAEALVRRVHADLAAVKVRTRAAGRPPTRVALVVEREPLYVVGAGSFVHALLAIAGGRNVFGDLESAFPQVSLEVLAERAPALLLDSTVLARAGPRAAADARRYWERVLPETRVAVLPRGDVTLPGPHLAQSAEILRQLIAQSAP
ncbi:MAG: ABC transporter substrate-binding protein [Myxococcota bacterium]